MAGLNSLPRLQPPKHTTLQNQLPAVSLALRAVDDAAVLWLPLSPLWFFQGDLTEAKDKSLCVRNHSWASFLFVQICMCKFSLFHKINIG